MQAMHFVSTVLASILAAIPIIIAVRVTRIRWVFEQEMHFGRIGQKEEE